MASTDKAAVEKEAASEIDISELPPEVAKVFKVFPRMAPIAAFHGIHGYIVMFKAGPGGPRFHKDELKKLMALPTFRWVGASERHGFSVGL